MDLLLQLRGELLLPIEIKLGVSVPDLGGLPQLLEALSLAPRGSAARSK